MNLKLMLLKTGSRTCHIETPHPGSFFTNLRARGVPVLLKIAHPLMQGEGVVLTQAFEVPHFKTKGLKHRDQGAYFVKLSVGEDVALYKRTMHP